MSKRVARAILRDCEEQLDELLPRMRRWFLPQYVALVARLLPRVTETGGVEVDAFDDDVAAAAIIADVCAALARIDAGQATLADLKAAMLGEGRHN
jgi:hypothetical protein